MAQTANSTRMSGREAALARRAAMSSQGKRGLHSNERVRSAPVAQRPEPAVSQATEPAAKPAALVAPGGSIEPLAALATPEVQEDFPAMCLDAGGTPLRKREPTVVSRISGKSTAGLEDQTSSEKVADAAGKASRSEGRTLRLMIRDRRNNPRQAAAAVATAATGGAPGRAPGA